MERATNEEGSRRGLAVAESASSMVDGGWGYVVTRDGRVVRVTQQHGVLIDDHGRPTSAPVVEDRSAAGEAHRAA